jgi:flagellin
MASIQTNILAVRGLRQYQMHQQGVTQAVTRLATGLRINRAADDPAGLVAAENLALDQRSLQGEIQGLERTNLLLAAKEGASSVVSEMLIELQALVTEAANTGGNTHDERQAIQQQVDGILDGFTFIQSTAEFNGERLLDGEAAAVFDELAQLHSGKSLSVLDGNMEEAQLRVESGVNRIATHRGEIGAKMRDIESQIRVKGITLENTAAAESLIRDADYAVEVSNMVREQLLRDLSLSGVSIALEQQQRVLDLLAPIRVTTATISKRAFN